MHFLFFCMRFKTIASLAQLLCERERESMKHLAPESVYVFELRKRFLLRGVLSETDRVRE